MKAHQRYRRYNRLARIRRRLFDLACAPTVREGLSEAEVRLNLGPHSTGLLCASPRNAPAPLPTAGRSTTTDRRP
jgi:hypothetical protein